LLDSNRLFVRGRSCFTRLFTTARTLLGGRNNLRSYLVPGSAIRGVFVAFCAKSTQRVIPRSKTTADGTRCSHR
jgi:hypothetical protein